MDIYGVKKYKLEQVFLDMTKVLSRTHVYKSRPQNNFSKNLRAFYI